MRGPREWGEGAAAVEGNRGGKVGGGGGSCPAALSPQPGAGGTGGLGGAEVGSPRAGAERGPGVCAGLRLFVSGAPEEPPSPEPRRFPHAGLGPSCEEPPAARSPRRITGGAGPGRRRRRRGEPAAAGSFGAASPGPGGCPQPGLEGDPGGGTPPRDRPPGPPGAGCGLPAVLSGSGLYFALFASPEQHDGLGAGGGLPRRAPRGRAALPLALHGSALGKPPVFSRVSQ